MEKEFRLFYKAMSKNKSCLACMTFGYMNNNRNAGICVYLPNLSHHDCSLPNDVCEISMNACVPC